MPASGSPRASRPKGTFVQPTIAEVPLDSWIWKKELFVPFVAVAPYDDLDEAIRLANDTQNGDGAGFDSEDLQQADWLKLHRGPGGDPARRAGATTGAWPACSRSAARVGHQRQAGGGDDGGYSTCASSPAR